MSASNEMPLPEPLPPLATKVELEHWFRKVFPDVNDNTNSPSYFDHLPNPNPYWTNMNNATTTEQRDAVISSYNRDCLELAPPLREQCWIMNQTFVEKALNHIADGVLVANAYKVLSDSYNQYIPQDAVCTDSVILGVYRQACTIFRNFMEETEEDLTGVLKGDVQTKLAVHPQTAARLRDMLLRMKQESERRFGATASRTDSSELLQGVKRFLRSCGEDEPPVPLTARNKMDINGYVLPKDTSIEPVRAAEPGIHLITTAIMQLRSRNDPQIEGLLAMFTEAVGQVMVKPGVSKEEREAARKLRIWKTIWDMEADEIIKKNSAAGQGLFSQQGAGIDLLFSAFFWAYKVGVRTYDDFKRLNKLCYHLGLRTLGASKIRLTLHSSMNPFASRILVLLSNCRDVHLPPFILNTSRVYDLVAAFGAFTTDDVRVNNVGQYGVSDRYVLNLKRSGPMALGMITISWSLWHYSKAGAPAEGDIASAEHLLHQFLLRKTSPFQNTHEMGGNALNVVIEDLGAAEDPIPEALDVRRPVALPERPPVVPNQADLGRAGAVQQPQRPMAIHARAPLPGRAPTETMRAYLRVAEERGKAIKATAVVPPEGAQAQEQKEAEGTKATDDAAAKK
nr:nucleocapsid protein [Sichuan tick nairovirus]USZ80659.1 nucleocapsid protein [Sichuan tick nairovirus]USZ80661.1 nucleocapsid protein [Sichuan tick nairovirus]USZ80664.1 nucleocapsid protein [Sichuan tick nairovirus]